MLTQRWYKKSDLLKISGYLSIIRLKNFAGWREEKYVSGSVKKRLFLWATVLFLRNGEKYYGICTCRNRVNKRF